MNSKLSGKPHIAKIQREELALPNDDYFRFMKWFRESYLDQYYILDFLDEDFSEAGVDAPSQPIEETS